jgi:hypothetical protein
MQEQRGLHRGIRLLVTILDSLDRTGEVLSTEY